jgi:hypothetical protein
MNISKTAMKVIFIIVLLLILLPLALLLLVQFAPPQEAPAQDEAGIADSTEDKSAAVKTHQARRENRATKQETTVIEPEPAPVWEIGAISTDPTRKTKQATPYRPGTVPGDSGVMVQYVGSPDDMVSGPQPLPPDDPWDGAVLPPMTPEQMRGIGGVRRIDPNDPFFQREIPNPFAN